jgi:hypothetical protein
MGLGIGTTCTGRLDQRASRSTEHLTSRPPLRLPLSRRVTFVPAAGARGDRTSAARGWEKPQGSPSRPSSASAGCARCSLAAAPRRTACPRRSACVSASRGRGRSGRRLAAWGFRDDPPADVRGRGRRRPDDRDRFASQSPGRKISEVPFCTTASWLPSVKTPPDFLENPMNAFDPSFGPPRPT